MQQQVDSGLKALTRRALVELGVFALVSLVLTWPLMGSFTHAIPQASEPVETVPLFNLWTMGWNVDRLGEGYQGYWDAPIFYSAQGTFAFSDPQPLTGLLGAVFWRLSPATAYNSVLILLLTLNGWSVYRLGRGRGISTLPAALSGMLAQAIPFLTNERGVLQLQPFFGMVWGIEGMLGLIAKPTWGTGLLVGFGAVVTTLTSEYYGLYLILLLAPLGVCAVGRWWKSRHAWLKFGAAGALVVGLTLPILLPQRAIIDEYGFDRSRKTITNLSAKPANYLELPKGVIGRDWLSKNEVKGQPLSPGVGLALAGLVGVVIGIRRRRERYWAAYLALSVAAFWLLSLGFNLELFGWGPYDLLYEYAPGFEHLRSPFRFVLWVQIGLALLAGYSLDAVWHRRGKWLALILGGLILLEIFPKPTKLTTVPQVGDISGVEAPAVFLPVADDTDATAHEGTVRWMLGILGTQTYLANGYSGYFTDDYRDMRRGLAEEISAEDLTLLQEMEVELMVIDAAAMTEEQLAQVAQLAAAGDLVWVGESAGMVIYALVGD